MPFKLNGRTYATEAEAFDVAIGQVRDDMGRQYNPDTKRWEYRPHVFTVLFPPPPAVAWDHFRVGYGGDHPRHSTLEKAAAAVWEQGAANVNVYLHAGGNRLYFLDPENIAAGWR